MARATEDPNFPVPTPPTRVILTMQPCHNQSPSFGWARLRRTIRPDSRSAEGCADRFLAMKTTTMIESRWKVLVVDDECENLQTFRRVFRREFSVECAGSGELGLAALEQRSFDCAFIDFAMPGMNGVEFLDRAATIQPGAIRFLLTAHAGASELEECARSVSSVDIIAKPWDKHEIVELVQKNCAIRARISA